MNYQALRHLRESKNLTQAQLAEKANLSDKTIRDIETGRNSNPSQATLDAVCRILCPDDPEKFWEAIKDDPDFSQEKDLLEHDRKHIPNVIVPILADLLNKEKENAVSYTISCLCGYLRGGSSQAPIRNTSITLLNAFATVVHTAQLSKAPLEVEAFTRYIIRDFESLAHSEGISQLKAEKGRKLISDLQNSRAANLSHDRCAAVREIFFWIYDAWEIICEKGITYEILSHIFILLDTAKDTAELRRILFYSAINHFYQAHAYVAI